MIDVQNALNNIWSKPFAESTGLYEYGGKNKTTRHPNLNENPCFDKIFWGEGHYCMMLFF